MSMFRSPEEVTPSDPESSSEDEGSIEVPGVVDDQYSVSEDAGATDQRIPQEGTNGTVDIDRSKQLDLFYSSLIEDFCTNKAIKTLKTKHPPGQPFSEDDAAVKALAKANYALLSRQLGSLGVIGQGYESDQWRHRRKTYRDALEVMLDHALEEGLISERGGTTSALLSPLATPFRSSQLHPVQSRPVTPRLLTGGSIKTESIPTIRERFGNVQLHNRPVAIAGSPPTAILSTASLTAQPIFQPSRYRTDFAELGLIGKGGYGKVFRVINRLDGQQYAIKKITLSAKRLKKLQNGGSNELELLLREIRALARLEHLNIVRYFGGWIEQDNATSTENGPRLTSQARPVLNDRPVGHDESFSLGLHFEDEQNQVANSGDDGGVLFGLSSQEDEEGNNNVKNRQRRASQLTASSTTTTKSLVRSTRDDEDDVESIPRLFGIPTQGQTSTDTESREPFSDAGYPHTPPKRPNGVEMNEPNWTLHIQMSLYPLSLATYLSSTSHLPAQGIALVNRHCFHLIPSVRILMAILFGVEYLHAHGLIHRDLKPANIFLSVHKGIGQSSGCIDISRCAQCERVNTDRMYVIPRIGDFGLVADISHPELDPSQCNGSSIVPFRDITQPLPSSYNPSTAQHFYPPNDRAIGTEFYRPPTRSAPIDEKLDVFSLGVIAFELLCKFETSKYQLQITTYVYISDRIVLVANVWTGMERHTVLANLNKGVFPSNFSYRIGDTSGGLEECLRAMLCADAGMRLSCKAVRERMERLIEDTTSNQ
ncbi:hypothetical protein MMC16_005250 [Acarospora aff. strigata]|nr:hypothetical protein [Acarospora aff. strigata]